jgi:hypothetical protein
VKKSGGASDSLASTRRFTGHSDGSSKSLVGHEQKEVAEKLVPFPTLCTRAFVAGKSKGELTPVCPSLPRAPSVYFPTRIK